MPLVVDPAETLTDALVADSDLRTALDPSDALAMGPRALAALRLIALLRHAEGVANALLEGCQDSDQDLPVNVTVAILAPLDAVDKAVLAAGRVTLQGQVIQFPGGHSLPNMTRRDLL